MIITVSFSEKKSSKFLLMRVLIALTVMEQWLTIGCTFCTVSGSGDAIVAPEALFVMILEIDFMHRKWPEVKKYLVYSQNFTNTHDKVSTQRAVNIHQLSQG